MINDGFINAMAGIGTQRDKASSASYSFDEPDARRLLDMFRSSWLARKVVTIPAHDATRKWRSWAAPDDVVTAIEAVERRLSVQRKLRDALICARLYGGSVIYISTGAADPSSVFDPAREKIAGLVVAPRHMAAPEIFDYDITSRYFGEPEFFMVGAHRVHRSRLVVFTGEPVPDASQRVWGDSVLSSSMDAIRTADATAANVASLVYEAKIDVFKVPKLMEIVSTPAGEVQFQKWASATIASKSNNGALFLDGGDTSAPEGSNGGIGYDAKSLSFGGLDGIWDRALQAVAGAADIPATRLLGQSPAGLNSTGESDLRNYYDRIQAMQEIDISAAMANLDDAIIIEATGDRDVSIYHQWRPLWQVTERERAEIAKMIADTASAMISADILPADVVSKAISSALIESGAIPGLDAAMREYGYDDL